MKYSGRIGLLAWILGFWLMTYVDNDKNDNIWYWREYTVMGKHTKAMVHKGNQYLDYYIEEKYADEPQLIYSVYSLEYQYNEVQEGRTYFKRDYKEDVYDHFYWLIFGLFGIGIILLTCAAVKYCPL